ncbi:bifunctional ADP-dependent NAD(P)H-hydrate dehydratase/NAD(P)H-hydrate epimerase [Geobacter anodireducens]|uniref:Bifunctional NAD(P)H-hydrate repair enzyme n=1 Tax=Geobacter soli TaxID=1510391 RepID=A0A0C1TML8_9BACT|nr:bifunctional ADP-dependent NAD(P)H-hydrate dehydratase/NAD(P)H-hydrate epimerase [Geobacter soli]KIE42144.1 ATP-binding protein [Geobacter soli]
MKVVSGETMQRMDRRTIDEFGIPGLVLMENAGRGCADAIREMFGRNGCMPVLVVAGKGNNGGDGYVIARLLAGEGWPVHTAVLARKDEIGGDARENLERLDPSTVSYLPAGESLSSLMTRLDAAALVVDALLGTGLKNDVQGVYAEAIRCIAASARPVVSVDIPSGIDAATGKVLGVAVTANLTVTFALAKYGHVLYPGALHCGRLKIVDIGIPESVAREADGVLYVDAAEAAAVVTRRDPCSHKGSFGHSLVIAGSVGKTGAAAMAANSAVRSGAGLVSLAVPASLNAILEVKTTEAMTIPLADGGTGFLGNESLVPLRAAIQGRDAVALGPGLSWQPATAALVRHLLADITAPLVLDADALNALSEQTDLLKGTRPDTVVLTPHPGEMARLAGTTTAAVEADRIGVARDFAARFGVYLILKGARSVIASPDGRMALNGSGNPGMASGGMGDVLTGVVTALLGQGYEPFAACTLGAFVHGHAADLVAADKGETGMSALDVQERLPHAFNSLIRLKGEQ